jgi:hypothetical protein
MPVPLLPWLTCRFHWWQDIDLCEGGVYHVLCDVLRSWLCKPLLEALHRHGHVLKVIGIQEQGDIVDSYKNPKNVWFANRFLLVTSLPLCERKLSYNFMLIYMKRVKLSVHHLWNELRYRSVQPCMVWSVERCILKYLCLKGQKVFAKFFENFFSGRCTLRSWTQGQKVFAKAFANFFFPGRCTLRSWDSVVEEVREFQKYN